MPLMPVAAGSVAIGNGMAQEGEANRASMLGRCN